MDDFDVIGRWIWLIFILVNLLNTGFFRIKMRRLVQEHPEREPGYRILARSPLLLNIPFLVMGVGFLVGKVPTILHFFRPQDANPYVLAFYGSVFLLWLFIAHWIFCRGGADMIVKHPGLFNMDFPSPKAVKRMWLAALLVLIGTLALMFVKDVPISLA